MLDTIRKGFVEGGGRARIRISGYGLQMEDWRSLTVTDSSKLLAGMTPEFEAELIEALAVCTAQITNHRATWATRATRPRVP